MVGTMEVLRDKRARPIGRILEGPRGRLEAYDRLGRYVGSYNPSSNETHDRHGNLVGRGNFLASLITSAL